MPTLTLIDRLRIERAVWTVDAYLSVLPQRRQRAIRRELRANLRASAAAVGSRAAVRDLGGLRRLSIDYLSAEYRGRPWPSLFKGLVWVVAAEALLLTAWLEAFSSYRDGLAAAGAAPGNYTVEWPLFGFAGEITVDGAGDFAREVFTLSPLPFFAWLAAVYVIGSRLWRAVPLWWDRLRGRRAPRAAGVAGPAQG